MTETVMTENGALYKIIRELPNSIIHFIWDVNGTITEKDAPDQEILGRIIQTAGKGAHHSFITGRDAEWLGEFLINPIKKINGFQKTRKNLHFYPELGLLTLDPVSGKKEKAELIKGHPIADLKTREKLAGLFYQEKDLLPYNGEKKAGYYLGGNANGKMFLIPEKPKVEFPWFIWSTSKNIIGTGEIIRNADATLNKECAKQVIKSTKRLDTALEKLELSEYIKPSPISTAINLVPVVEGSPLDKNMAAGLAIKIAGDALGVSLPEIAGQTVAIGDGAADLMFATPILGIIPIFFVGPKTQLNPTPMQEKQLAIVGQGAFLEGGKTGVQVTKQVFELAAERIPENKAIFIPGNKGKEVFSPEVRLMKGVHERIVHITNALTYHDAALDPQIQAGHSHSNDYETIILSENGKIDAMVWSEEGAEIYRLREKGDMVTFPPRTNHTLIVKEKDTMVKVVKNSPNPFRRQDKWIPEEIPLGIQKIRDTFLTEEISPEESVSEAEKLIESI